MFRKAEEFLHPWIRKYASGLLQKDGRQDEDVSSGDDLQEEFPRGPLAFVLARTRMPASATILTQDGGELDPPLHRWRRRFPLQERP